MQTVLNIKIAESYKSNSQKIRVMSEKWTKDNIFCPSCGDGIENYENNKPVADFYCKKCFEDFELKSKKGKIGKKIGAGAYSKIIERLKSEGKPNFFFMAYQNETYFVNNFFVVPKYFFVPEIIEKRKALSGNAKGQDGLVQIYYFQKFLILEKFFILKMGMKFRKKRF